MYLFDCRTNGQQNPIGICLDQVTLSWKVGGSKGTKAVSTTVEVATDEAFQEVVIRRELPADETWGCDFHVDITDGNCGKLAEGKTYFWRVAVTDDAGDETTSLAWHFEGGHPLAPWKGSFITAPFTRNATPLFLREFTLEKPVEEIAKARIYVCGLGLYEVYLNGEKVGKDYFAPFYTDYRYWIQYQTYDLLPYLKDGENRLEVWMGEGWYMGRYGYLGHGQLTNYYGDEFLLLADLLFTDLTGETFGFGTDEKFAVCKSPIIKSNLYDGEIYDARMAQDLEIAKRTTLPARRLNRADLFAKLSPMLGLPVRKKEEFDVKEIIHTKLGETVLDFGQEITGWVEFTAPGAEGARIDLQYGEVLQDGCFYRDNLRTAEATYTYFCDDQARKVRPHFTFFGFRYVKVTGMEVTEENRGDFTAHSFYSNLPEIGFIETSDEKIGRLISNTKWSQKDNFLDIPTDCPQRDERLGWTGDAQIFSGAASFHMETAQFYRKYLKDMRFEQGEKDGSVPYVVPDALTVGRRLLGEPEFAHDDSRWGEDGSCAWGEAATVIPWNTYLFYGDKRLLAEEYPGMKAWVDFICRMDEECCGNKRLWTCGFHFGDWLSLDSEGYDDARGGTDPYFVASMYYMYSASLVAKAAGVLGKKAEEAFYKKRAVEVRNAIRETYLIAPGTLQYETQTAYVLGLWFDLFAEEEKEEAANHLRALLKKYDNKLSTGFVGTAYLAPALTKIGASNLAYDLLFNEDYPGWLYEVNLGATTIWERWNSILPDGLISGTGMNSLNHYAYGVIVEWIYRTVCGLNPVEEKPGFRKIRFAPRVDERLSYARVDYHSVSGEYQCGWRRDGGKIVYHLTVPFGCRAEFAPETRDVVILVNGKTWEGAPEFGPGNYEISVG